MKRSLQLVLAVVGVVAGLALVGPAAPVAAAPPAPKVFTVAASPASSVWSQTVKLTAVLTPKGGGTPKGGTIAFTAGGLLIGEAVATTRNTTLTTSALPPGTHVVGAEYSGDAVTAPSTSTTTVTVTVAPAPTQVTLRATTNPVPYDDRAEIKAVVTAVAPAVSTRRPTGTVTFETDTCVDATVQVNANGVATWRPWLCPGEHEVRATYNGSDRHAASEAATPLSLTVDGPEGPDDEDIDQVNEGDPSGMLAISDDGETSSRYAQTFTAGRTGQLYAVDLVLGWTTVTDTEPGPLRVTIQTVDEDGHPTGAVQGSGQVVVGDRTQDVPEIVHLDLDVAAGVEEGGTYAIVLEVDPQTPEAFGIWFAAASTGDGYAAGEVHEQVDGGAWTEYVDPDADLMFRTHVGPPV